MRTLSCLPYRNVCSRKKPRTLRNINVLCCVQWQQTKSAMAVALFIAVTMQWHLFLPAPAIRMRCGSCRWHRQKIFAALSSEQRGDLARALKTVLLKYEGLWQRPFPYLMSWFQAPLDGQAHPETQLHAQFYPPYRSRDRLKFLAGTELAAGLFVMDTLPETTACELQQVVIEMVVS